MTKLNMKKGVSLIEILIVVAIFAILGVLVARSVIMTLRGSRKSESQIKVKENLNYAFSVIERQIRNSSKVTCPNADPYTVLNYLTLEEEVSSFSCDPAGYIASGSGRLTSEDVEITNCSIVCEKIDSVDLNEPAKVKISVSAQEVTSQGAEKGIVTMETEIVVRNF